MTNHIPSEPPSHEWLYHLKLIVLGSGGSAVSAKRACPSFLLEDTTLFDLGPGSLHNLRISQVDPNKIRRLFISHPHADHISDLIPFLWAIQIDGRQDELKVYGPPGFKEVFRKLLECTNTSPTFFTFPLSIEELNFGDKLDNISTCATVHSIPTLAFRVDSSDGRSFCYSADTAYCSNIVTLAKNVDLLLHEATFVQDQATIADLTKHSTAHIAGQVAREADAKRLVLFHVPPPNENREKEFTLQAETAFGGRCIISTDMAEFEI
jgi:ribonuclease BN (tRNA processing enzyme)